MGTHKNRWWLKGLDCHDSINFIQCARCGRTVLVARQDTDPTGGDIGRLEVRQLCLPCLHISDNLVTIYDKDLQGLFLDPKFKELVDTLISEYHAAHMLGRYYVDSCDKPEVGRSYTFGKGFVSL